MRSAFKKVKRLDKLRFCLDEESTSVNRQMHSKLLCLHTRRKWERSVVENFIRISLVIKCQNDQNI